MKIIVGASVKWHARIAAELDTPNILISYVHFLTPKLAARGLRQSAFDYLIHTKGPLPRTQDDGKQ